MKKIKYLYIQFKKFVRLFESFHVLFIKRNTTKNNLILSNFELHWITACLTYNLLHFIFIFCQLLREIAHRPYK